MQQYEISINVKETRTVVMEHQIEGVILNEEQYKQLVDIITSSAKDSSVSIVSEEKPLPEENIKQSKSDRRSKYTYDDDYILAELAKGRKESSIAKELNIPYQTFHNHITKIKESSSKDDTKEDV